MRPSRSNCKKCRIYHGTRLLLTQRLLWDGDWKLAFNGFDYDELYDLANDPWETRNLLHDGGHEERHRTMMAAIWERIRATRDRSLLQSHYYSLRLGVVGPGDPGPNLGYEVV